MKLANVNELFSNEDGAALMQVVMIGAFLAILAFMVAQMMTTADRQNLRMVNRNQNLTSAILFSDHLADKHVVKYLGTVPSQTSTGATILYP